MSAGRILWGAVEGLIIWQGEFSSGRIRLGVSALAIKAGLRVFGCEFRAGLILGDDQPTLRPEIANFALTVLELNGNDVDGKNTLTSTVELLAIAQQ